MLFPISYQFPPINLGGAQLGSFIVDVYNTNAAQPNAMQLNALTQRKGSKTQRNGTYKKANGTEQMQNKENPK